MQQQAYSSPIYWGLAVLVCSLAIVNISADQATRSKQQSVEANESIQEKAAFVRTHRGLRNIRVAQVSLDPIQKGSYVRRGDRSYKSGSYFVVYEKNMASQPVTMVRRGSRA